MKYPEQPLTSHLVEQIKETFHKADVSLIKSVIYFDGWADYEECGGILVFRAIDDSIQIVDYGYCVMAEDNTNYFHLRETSLEGAYRQIENMEKAIKETNESMSGSFF